MLYKYFPECIVNIIISQFSDDEKYYIFNEWRNIRNPVTFSSINGFLDLLKYLHENGCPLSKYMCSTAAVHGHLKILKYAHENGCMWDEITCLNAAYHGHLKILKYLT